MPRKPTLADRFLSEVILYGCFPVTRATAYALALDATGDERAADCFAFAPGLRALPGETPMTREEVDAEMEKIENNRRQT